MVRPIRIVPHFMRLHEWIALDEGMFADEGLAAEILADDMHQISSHGADVYFDRPQDRPFVANDKVCSSACEWAVPMNAGAGMGKAVLDVYGVARFALFVAPESKITRLTQLKNVQVGIGLMAGSHFSFLETMERVMPHEHIRAENIGGPGRRLAALLAGEIEAANLLDPEIAIADELGLRRIAAGEFRTLFWVADALEPEVLAAYFRAMRRAQAALEGAPERYMHLWERNIPPILRNRSYDLSRFGLGELLEFEPYAQEDYERTLALARRWGLDRNLRSGSGRLDNIGVHILGGTGFSLC